MLCWAIGLGQGMTLTQVVSDTYAARDTPGCAAWAFPFGNRQAADTLDSRSRFGPGPLSYFFSRWCLPYIQVFESQRGTEG